jgi:hypothetical protein
MADSYTKRISELQSERKKNLRQAKRARQRRRKALRQRRWKDARSAKETARRNNEAAQKNLRDMRALRKARSKAGRLARLIRHGRSAGKAADGGKLMWFTGRPVRASLYPHLVWARQHGWRGVVTSGYRTPAYSQSLCYAMCGRPSCPGRCAGTSSNHVRTAIDVSDYGTFGQLMKKCPHKPRIYNALGARDPVHYSPNGR